MGHIWRRLRATALRSRPGQVLAAFAFAALVANCGTHYAVSPYHPKSINDVPFRERAQSKYDNDVRVTAAVPTAEEAEALFGANLAGREIQPVWLKVENHSDRAYYLLTVVVDPNHYSPNEASYAVHGGLDKAERKEMEYRFRSLTFRNPVPPDAAVSGFVFTNLDEGEKVVQVDLVAERRLKTFTFFVPIPGMRVDYRKVDFKALYPVDEFDELNREELRLVLEKLPCCTTNAEGTGSGDPLNLVVVGDFQDIAAAFARRGWLPAEETYSTAVWKTIKSYFFGSRYRYSPISPLYFLGRHQDFARQKPRHDVHERNHLRLWYTSMRYEGKPVFVGQISRDIGVRFTSKVWPPVTHKIDPDVDEARESLIEDLVLSGTVSTVGFVKGVVPATASRPRANLTGDPYFTDGLRAVLLLEEGPIPLNRIRSLHWESPNTYRFGGLGEEPAPANR